MWSHIPIRRREDVPLRRRRLFHLRRTCDVAGTYKNTSLQRRHDVLLPGGVMLSKYCKKIADKYEIKVDDINILIPNLGNKTNYVVHYRNLQLYLSLGMKLTKIHGVLEFKQSDWMKKYIDFNTEKRMNAVNDFQKDFFKLIINSVYGKAMENLRKRIIARLVNNAKDFLKYTSKPTFLVKIMLLFMKLNLF